jgi:hypothetical protein
MRARLICFDRLSRPDKIAYILFYQITKQCFNRTIKGSALSKKSDLTGLTRLPLDKSVRKLEITQCRIKFLRSYTSESLHKAHSNCMSEGHSKWLSLLCLSASSFYLLVPGQQIDILIDKALPISQKRLVVKNRLSLLIRRTVKAEMLQSTKSPIRWRNLIQRL